MRKHHVIFWGSIFHNNIKGKILQEKANIFKYITLKISLLEDNIKFNILNGQVSQKWIMRKRQCYIHTNKKEIQMPYSIGKSLISTIIKEMQMISITGVIFTQLPDKINIKG